MIDRVGFSTLFRKEIRRFSKVWMQTVFSPLITTSLYFLVFGVALGSQLTTVEIDGQTVRYIEFVIPGLMMLAMISNSFLNTSSSLFQSKINGTITDLLVAPIGVAEWLLAYVSAAMVRGLLVGVLVWVVASAFVGVHIAAPWAVLVFSVGVTASFALLGIVAAVWAEKFDQLSIIPNFVLTPLTFLGGVFYSVHMLPEPWATISRLDPVLYMVNGLRYGLLGVSDVSVAGCLAAVGITFAVALSAATWVLASGWKLRV